MTLVVLDIGATLVTGPDRGPSSRLAAELGLDAGQRDLLRDVIMTTELETPEQLSQLVDEATGIDSSAAVARLWHAQASEARPIEGARRAFERLAGAGLELALISNIWRPYLESVRSHFGDLFDAHIPSERQLFSFREGAAKPDRTLFELLLARTPTSPRETVMVGDSYREDIAPAASLGIATLWLLHRPELERDAVEQHSSGNALAPTLTLDSIAELDPASIERVLSKAAEGAVSCA